MRQVLFFIPVKTIGANLPDISLLVPIILLALGIIVGRVRRLGKNYHAALFTIVGLLVGLVFFKENSAKWNDLPIYGYGAMLFLAFVFCNWLAGRLAAREGIELKLVQDLAIWMFGVGIVGARLTFMLQYRHGFASPWQQPGDWLVQFFTIWEGGLVFYGGAIGGTVGYSIAYFVFLRKSNVSSWKMADVIAPCAALGLCLGRVGCLLNGCCYGNVACPDCPAMTFPLSSPPRETMVKRGYQTTAGFTFDPRFNRTVGAVEPASPAELAGLKPGDIILMVNGEEVRSNSEIEAALDGRNWKRGKNDLALQVRHANGRDEELPNFNPLTIGLHPTQLYETISMGLLFFLLLSFYPFKRHDGAVMVLFMLAYAVHRYLNEMLRTDTDPVAFGMTLSQNISIVVFVLGLLLLLWVWFKPASPASTPAAPAAADSATVPIVSGRGPPS